MLSYSSKSEGAIINLCCVIINLVVFRVVCRLGLQILSLTGTRAAQRVRLASGCNPARSAECRSTNTGIANRFVYPYFNTKNKCG